MTQSRNGCPQCGERAAIRRYTWLVERGVYRERWTAFYCGRDTCRSTYAECADEPNADEEIA